MVEEYFILIVGEMGNVSPEEFYRMTLREADLMSQGYKRRLQQNNNVMFNACINALGTVHCEGYKYQPLFDDTPQTEILSKEQSMKELEYLKNMMIMAGESIGK